MTREDRFAVAIRNHESLSDRVGEQNWLAPMDQGGADLALEYIRSLQALADILDEAPGPPTSLGERQATMVLATSGLIQVISSAMLDKVPRPNRHFLSLMFPNTLIRRLKRSSGDAEKIVMGNLTGEEFDA